MTEDPFEKFAEHYDRMVQEEPDQVEFFRTLFDKHDVKSVLDCACGTGNDLIRVYNFGLQVCGSDISEAMLAQARRKLSQHQIEIPLEHVDFRELPQHYDRRFDAVLCLTTSLPQLLKESEIGKALQSMREVLNPNGILVLTQGLTDVQFKERVRFAPAVNDPDFSRIMVVDYYDEDYEVNVLDLVHSHDHNEFSVYGVRYRILLQDDYERLLRAAGYGKIEFYGDWNFKFYDKEESELLIVVAYK